jgi:hypothetical protein
MCSSARSSSNWMASRSPSCSLGRPLRARSPRDRTSYGSNNTWVKKTVEFKSTDDEDVKYTVINRAGRFTWWMVAVLGAGPMYLTVEPSPA